MLDLGKVLTCTEGQPLTDEHTCETRSHYVTYDTLHGEGKNSIHMLGPDDSIHKRNLATIKVIMLGFQWNMFRVGWGI